jgi:hypothetical protein
VTLVFLNQTSPTNPVEIWFDCILNPCYIPKPL